MEEKRDRDSTGKYDSFLTLLEQAQKGDEKAMEELLMVFESDFEYLAGFIKLPRDEALQTLKTEFIEMIRKGIF